MFREPSPIFCVVVEFGTGQSMLLSFLLEFESLLKVQVA